MRRKPAWFILLPASGKGMEMEPLSSGYARVNGIDLYYETYGCGALPETLVLLHGFSGTGRSHWHRQIPALCQRYRLVVPDLRGHGKSKCRNVPYDYWELVASDIAALTGHLGLGKVHICGFSLGSLIAQFVALDHPGLVRSLVLASTLAHVPMKEGHGLLGFVESLTRPDEVSATWRKSLTEMHGDPEWRLLFESYGRTILARLRSTGGELTRRRLGEIACPTLIVQGQRDTLNPPELAEVVHRGIRGSQLVTLPGGHRVHESEAQEFNRLVVGFLDRLT